MLQQSNPSKKDVLNQYEKQPLDKIFALLKPYRRLLVTSFFLAILFNMIGLTVPWMLKIANLLSADAAFLQPGKADGALSCMVGNGI